MCDDFSMCSLDYPNFKYLDNYNPCLYKVCDISTINNLNYSKLELTFDKTQLMKNDIYIENTSVKLINNNENIEKINKCMLNIGFVHYLRRTDNDISNHILSTNYYVIYFKNQQIVIRLCLIKIKLDLIVEFTNICSKRDFFELYQLIISKLCTEKLINS